MDRYIGRLLDNRYEILEVIGTGGMAVVYKARCHRLNRLVAIKILKDEYCKDEEFRRRFHAEGQAVAMLSHPNIVQVYDVSSSDEADYIVMELIDGITLKQYMEIKGVLNWKETLHFAMQIGKALEHAHSRSIVHRDIKPHNVMVLKNGSVKVADFGIARVMSKSNTLTKEALGSVHYISPEQAKGGRVDNRSDIYSLGVVMYEMMTGRPPYDGESPVAVAIQHINGGAAMPSTLNPNIPGGLEQIIMKAMAHEPNDRYATATAMLYDMEEFRKDPAMLFGYTVTGSAVDDATRIHSGAYYTDPNAAKPKTTAERVAGGRTAGAAGAAAAAGAASRGGTSQTGSRTPSRAGTQRTASEQAKKNAAARRKPVRVEEEDEEDRNNRAATIAIVVCSLVAMLAIAIFLITLLNGGLFTQHEELIMVPRLVGQYYDNLPEYANVVIVLDHSEYNEKYGAGQIIDQVPAANTEVSKGAKVYVTVSLGEEPEVKTMPGSIIGVDVEEAIKYLDGYGLNLHILKKPEASNDIKENSVIRSEPSEGEVLVQGADVTLYYSTGPDIAMRKMPNVVGRSYDIAVKVLKAAGFENVVAEYVESEEPADTVVKQPYDRDTELDVTTVIILEVSEGPKLPETKDLPDVTGMEYSAAVRLLNAVGFHNVTSEYVESDKDKDTVVGMTPDADTTQELTVQVTLLISEGPKETEPVTEPEEDPVLITYKIENLPDSEESFILSLRLNDEKVVEDAEIAAGTESVTVELMGTGVQYYDLYINDVYYRTEKVDFTVEG